MIGLQSLIKVIFSLTVKLKTNKRYHEQNRQKHDSPLKRIPSLKINEELIFLTNKKIHLAPAQKL